MWDEDIVSDRANTAQDGANQPVQPLTKPILVIDTNAFIKCLDLQGLHEKYDLATTAEVKFEIRDKRARDKFLTLPFDLETKEPSKTASSAVRKFATATGDIASLSAVDLKVIAVCYTYAELNGTAGQLRKDPPEIKEAFAKKDALQEGMQQLTLEEANNQGNGDGGQEWSDDENEDDQKKEEITGDNQDKEDEDDGWNVVPVKEKKLPPKKNKDEFGTGWNFVDKTAPKQSEAAKEKPIPEKVEAKIEETATTTTEPKEKKQTAAEESDDEDDGQGWINTNNLHLYKDQGNSKTEITTANIGVSIMTADFAMQNVALQMGIPLVSIDGMMITRAKRFVLECFACLALVKDMTKSFCPKCGNHSLLKVSCSFEADGQIKLYRKKGFKVNRTGFIYPIPKPQIGKHANNLILKEDELLRGNKLTQVKIAQKQQEKEFNRNMMEFESGFALADVKHKQHLHSDLQFGYGNINPNNVSQTKHHKRK